ncbi:MAG: recombinase family protein [Hyphomicrobiales bacterium]|nr:MAG: recombinase family protein [Hyphomicrobiales bacterium]
MGHVAIYARVSTAEQDTDRQVRELQAYAERLGHTVVGVFTEKASGAKDNRPERAKVLELARKRQVNAVLVSEMSRWGRSTQDLLATLQDLSEWGVSLLSLNGLAYDRTSAMGKLMTTMLAGIAEFERDLIRDRVKSGLAAAKAKGKVLGRRVGQRPSDKKAAKVLELHKEGLSYRLIGRNLGLSKNTVADIVQRAQA